MVALYLNILPEITWTQADVSAQLWAQLLERARDSGDVVEKALQNRLAELEVSCELRRFDVFAPDVASVSAQRAQPTALSPCDLRARVSRRDG